MGPLHCLVGWCFGPCTADLFELQGGPFEVEVRNVEQDLIPDVGQLVLSNVPVMGWIIDPYEHSLLDSPSDGM